MAFVAEKRPPGSGRSITRLSKDVGLEGDALNVAWGADKIAMSWKDQTHKAVRKKQKKGGRIMKKCYLLFAVCFVSSD